MAVERDSRTYKQAASLANLGYRSIVVEGERSTLGPESIPFELAAIDGAAHPWGSNAEVGDQGPRPSVAASPTPIPVSALGRLRRRLDVRLLENRGRRGILRLQIEYNKRTYRSLPPASLYILHGYMQSPAVLAAALRHRARIAYDSHDAYFEIRPGQLDEDIPWQRLWQLAERALVKTATGFATVSDGLADVLEERHRRRPVTIRNLHDFRIERVAEGDVRSAAGVSPGDYLLVSIGNDKDGMAVDEALQALAELPADVHIAWVGRGFETHAHRARELGVEDRAHFVGAVSPTAVVDFVRAADAAVVLYWPITANYRNALPNGFFQAVAAGLPVLYSPKLVEVDSLNDEHSFGSQIDTQDPASIAAGITALRDDEARTADLRANAEHAREAMNWEREEKRLGGYVSSMLAGERQ